MPGGSKPRVLNVRPQSAAQAREAKANDAHRRARIKAARRKPVRQRSARMTARMKLYNERKAAYLTAHPYCCACKQLAAAIEVPGAIDGLAAFQKANSQQFAASVATIKQHPATTIHHRRGRGKLLLAEEHWAGACVPSHRFITDNPTLATAAGLGCEQGEWWKP